MFLSSISLRNVRCFRRLDVSFLNEDGGVRKWTLLLGQNGTGKSNLLKAIALVTAGSDALPDVLGQPEDWIQHGKDFCEFHAVLETKEQEQRKLRIRIDRGDKISDVIVKNQDGLDEIDNALEYTDRHYYVSAYGVSRRLNRDKSVGPSDQGYRHERSRRIASLFDPNTVLNPLESWAMDLDYSKNGNGVKTVRQALNSFLRGVRFSHIDKKKKQLLFKTPDGVVPLGLLSEGYQSVATWIGDLLYHVTNSFQDYKAPLDARGLLIVDELDLHLHPQWQRELNRFLTARLPNFQIIATTHSPLTAQQAGEGELHSLHRRGKTVSLEAFAGNPRLLLLHQLVMSDLFGLDSDESLMVEQRKTEYRRLRDKRTKSDKDKSRLKALKAQMKELPVVARTNVLAESGPLADLKKIYQELSASQK